MNKITSITIARIGNHRTLKYAAEELRKYLKKLDSKIIVDIRLYDEYDENRKNFLWLGLSDKFDSKLPGLANKTLDDAIYVDVTDFSGVNGEIIRKRAFDNCSVKACEAASYRHRAICLEGAVS